jgi:hypothetical protein
MIVVGLLYFNFFTRKILHIPKQKKEMHFNEFNIEYNIPIFEKKIKILSPNNTSYTYNLRLLTPTPLLLSPPPPHSTTLPHP